jgi:hypothetical protein
MCGRLWLVMNGSCGCRLRWHVLDALSGLVEHALEALTESFLKQVIIGGLGLLLHLLLRLFQELQGLRGRSNILICQVLVQMLFQYCVELLRLKFR